MNLNFVNSPHQCLTWRMKKISNLDNIEKFLQLHYIGLGKEEKYLVHLTDEAPIIIVLTQKFVCCGLLDRTWTQQHNSESTIAQSDEFFITAFYFRYSVFRFMSATPSLWLWQHRHSWNFTTAFNLWKIPYVWLMTHTMYSADSNPKILTKIMKGL